MSRTLIHILSLFLSLLVLMGCMKEVPAGHVGHAWEPGGFEGEILNPGRHECFGRCKMYLMETGDRLTKINMSVLCQDQLNFKFDVKVLTAVDKTNPDKIKAAFENIVPPSETPLKITSAQLFEMYVEPVVDQTARGVVSKYRTDEISSNRAKIITELQAAIKEEFKGSLVMAKRITVNNLDFPAALTEAQEEKAKRRIEIETEKAEQEKRLIKANNELELAAVNYKRELIEASMVADANKIIGSSITPAYLGYKQLEVIQAAASGPNNWGFVPYTDHMNNIKWTQSEGILDAELLRRVQEARKGNVKPEAKVEAKPKTPSKKTEP